MSKEVNNARRKKTSFTLSDVTYQRICRLQEKLGISKSSVLSLAIAAFEKKQGEN